MTAATRKKLRAIIRAWKWKRATSPQFKHAPHSYVVWHSSDKKDWDFFVSAIRKHGVWRRWHGNRYRYLLIDSYVFWCCWPCLNRAKADTLDKE
jgi:hypothetical protein